MRFSILFAFLSSLPLANGAQLYSVTSLGPGFALAINNQGQVLARDGLRRPFLFSNGQTQYLPQPVGGTFLAGALNDLGQVAGSVNFSGQLNYDLAIYSQGSLNVMTNLSGLVPTAINNSGQISGDRVFDYQMFLYSDGTLTPIGTLPGTSESVSRGMDAAGNVLGRTVPNTGMTPQGFLYSNGKLTPIVPLPSGYLVDLSGIYDSGEVIGGYSLSPTSLSTRLFIYRDGQYQLLPPAFHLTDESDGASSSNGAGVIVGTTEAGSNLLAWSFVPQSGFSNLNDEIAPDSGWSLQSATGINNQGQIVGYGQFRGQEQAFLLTPVPEPTLFPVVLLLLGLKLSSTKSRPERPAQATGLLSKT